MTFRSRPAWQITCPRELMQRVDALAREEGKTRSAFIEDLLREKLEEKHR